jgi:hypothetical protein|tara:strand:+ start:244 stop:462 length:219 start_codon:yes stop_codon:yes gene_type:complete
MYMRSWVKPLVIALLVGGTRAKSSHERVAKFVQDIKAAREWIVSVRPVWVFMTKEEALISLVSARLQRWPTP